MGWDGVPWGAMGTLGPGPGVPVPTAVPGNATSRAVHVGQWERGKQTRL